ncbi:MAG: transcription elongation factor NusA [Candidatus Nitrosotenuis sp.]
MQVPICVFDAKNSVLCPQCESKLESGQLTQADVDASMKIAKLAKTNSEIDKFSIHACRQIGLNHILYLSKSDIDVTRKSRTLYRALSGEFSGKLWLVESEASDRKFIEDLFFPTRILSINAVWAPGGLQKTKVIISGKRTSKFPIDITQVANIVKEMRQLDMVIEFEEDGKK